MKSLIRFEDTYGITDIFCARIGIDYIDIEKIHDRLIKINNDTFIDFGLASGWGSISNDEAYLIMEMGIDRIIFVYDMDSLHGDKTRLISRKELLNILNSIKNKFYNIGYNIETCFIPVVYAAETIMLYQFLCEKEDDESKIFNLVSKEDTCLLHLYLLTYLIGESNYKKAKKVRNFLNIDKLIYEFNNMSDYDPNFSIKQWVINGCNTDYKGLFSSREALDNLEDVTQNFNFWKKHSNRTITLDNIEIQLNNIQMLFKNT